MPLRKTAMDYVHVAFSFHENVFFSCLLTSSIIAFHCKLKPNEKNKNIETKCLAIHGGES